jgi:hypothetical protein
MRVARCSVDEAIRTPTMTDVMRQGARMRGNVHGFERTVAATRGMCYDVTMTIRADRKRRTRVLVAPAEEMPMLSEQERTALHSNEPRRI